MELIDDSLGYVTYTGNRRKDDKFRGVCFLREDTRSNAAEESRSTHTCGQHSRWFSLYQWQHKRKTAAANATLYVWEKNKRNLTWLEICFANKQQKRKFFTFLTCSPGVKTCFLTHKPLCLRLFSLVYLDSVPSQSIADSEFQALSCFFVLLNNMNYCLLNTILCKKLRYFRCFTHNQLPLVRCLIDPKFDLQHDNSNHKYTVHPES